MKRNVLKAALAMSGAILTAPLPALGQSAEESSSAVAEVVRTPLGAVRGEAVTTNGLTALTYRGIPYAAPPVGERRFKAPEAPESWEGVRDATEWPDRCVQSESSIPALGRMSEDCLYLNVVTAAERSDEKRPVMVFFHGGGLRVGTGNSPTYTHPMLATKGVVLVTVNSRLGPFGYLAHPALSEEGGGSGNYGTLDLAASLKWVEDNIIAFGGDPDNVTIFGESGGGTKTVSQLATPRADVLFDKAIVQSGSRLVTEASITPLDEAESAGEALVTALGIDPGEDVASALREASWDAVLSASAETDFEPRVVVDGEVVPAAVTALFEQGRQHQVPLIVGANEGESMLQTSVPMLAELHSASGAPTYVYNFSQLPKGWREEEGCVAFHGLELSYMFGSIPLGLQSPTTLYLAQGGNCSTSVPEHDQEDLRVADRMASLWAAFAKTGDPSVEGIAQWPRYTEDDPAYLDIGATFEVRSGIEDAYVAPGRSAD